MDPINAIIAGMLLGLSLAAPPGPILAIMLDNAARGYWQNALKMAGGAILGDLVWFLGALLGLTTVLKDAPTVKWVLGLGGAALLIWMGIGILRSAWAHNEEKALAGHSDLGSIPKGFATALGSPYNLAWWLANANLILEKMGSVGVIALFSALVLFTITITAATYWLGKRVRSIVHPLSWLSGFTLVGFGIYFAWGLIQG